MSLWVKILKLTPPLNTNFANGYLYSSMPPGCNVLNNANLLMVWFTDILTSEYANMIVRLLMSLKICVCVEVLRPSQPNGVMSSAVSLPNHTFTGQA